MTRALLTIAILFLSLQLISQIEKRDSLLKLLPSANEDTSRVLLSLHLADVYETNNQDSCRFYLEEAKRLSSLIKFERGLYLYYEQLMILSFTKGEYDSAMVQSGYALELARKLNDSGAIINILANTGILYQYLGQFDKNLEYLLQALDLLEKRKETNKLSAIYHNIGNAYFNLNQYRKSLDYCFLSLKIYFQTGKNSYPNRVYAAIGQNYAELRMTDSALHYYKISVTESIKVMDKYAEGTIYGYMADTYAARSDYKEMLEVAKKSYSLSKELQSSQMLASSLYNLAYANHLNGDNAVAKNYINEALDLATKDSLTDELKNIYTVLSFVAAREGDGKTSYWAKQKYDSIQKALLNEQVIKTTAELEKKYESEKKDKQIILQQSQLQKKEIMNYILIGSAAIVIVISILLYRNYRQKQKLQQQRIRELEKEQQLMAIDAVLKGEEKERTRLAKDLHDGLGGMLSGIRYSFQNIKENLVMTPDNHLAFERGMDMLNSSIKEMRRVAHNMMPESLVKFGLDTALKDFCNDINQSGAIHTTYQSIGLENSALDQTTSISIYRIVQELINNTMKHASAKTAIVQVFKTKGEISITVEDDGKGFDPMILQMANGIGWSNIQSRVDFLKGKINIQSEKEKGTSVHIELNT
jgi:signal transduction histidine kinase